MAEFAYEPEPELNLAPGESFREISGRSPWAIAGRRLVRNRLAMASLGLFVLIVVLSFLAPVYAKHVAHTDPNTPHISATTTVNGKQVEVLQPSAGGSTTSPSQVTENQRPIEISSDLSLRLPI